MAEDLPHVVIVGAGFGGLRAARTLARAPVRVTVLDRRNRLGSSTAALKVIAVIGPSGAHVADASA